MTHTNLPHIYGYVSGKYIGLAEGEKREVVIFGCTAIAGRALLFHCQLRNGACYWRLPVEAFSWKEESGSLPLEELEIWDNPSEQIEVTTYDWLCSQVATLHTKRSGTQQGTYVCTLDYVGSGTTAEIPEEHKCKHMIRLDNGQFALYPNNRMVWKAHGYTLSDDKEYFKYKVNRGNSRGEYWSVETLVSWEVPDNDSFMYVEGGDKDE